MEIKIDRYYLGKGWEEGRYWLVPRKNWEALGYRIGKERVEYYRHCSKAPSPEKQVEEIPEWSGCYSTADTLIIGQMRIPRRGLTAVFYGEDRAISPGIHVRIYIDCFYQYGHRLSFLHIPPKPGNAQRQAEEFKKALRKFDETLPVYRHFLWCGSRPRGFTYAKFVSIQPSLNQKAIELLPSLHEGNPYWEAACKSRLHWTGNYEIELYIRGTFLTQFFFFLFAVITLVLMMLAALLNNFLSLILILGIIAIAFWFYCTVFLLPMSKFTVEAMGSLNTETLPKEVPKG